MLAFDQRLLEAHHGEWTVADEMQLADLPPDTLQFVARLVALRPLPRAVVHYLRRTHPERFEYTDSSDTSQPEMRLHDRFPDPT